MHYDDIGELWTTRFRFLVGTIRKVNFSKLIYLGYTHRSGTHSTDDTLLWDRVVGVIV